MPHIRSSVLSSALALGVALAFTSFNAAAQTAVASGVSGTNSSALDVAVVPNYPPFEYRDADTNELKGLDIDLGKALSKRMGIPFHWQETSFDTMLSSLQTGRVSLILSGMTDLPTRRATVNFVDYIKTGPQFYILATHRADFPSMTALCGKRVGTSRRTSFPQEVTDWSALHCVQAGLPAITVVGTEGSADARLQLRQGRVDAAVQGGETLAWQNSIDANAYVAVGAPISSQYTAIAVGKSNSVLEGKVKTAFQQMLADGSYRAILAKWGLLDHALDRIRINAED